MGVIVDTCIWIDVERGTISPADVARYTKEEPVFISPVSIAELSYGSEIAATEAIRQKRLAALHRMKKKPSLNIDEETGEIFGSLAAHLKKAGRTADYRIQDVWIGSQAIQHGYRLLTRNRGDFQDIPGLDLIIYGEKAAP
jgi:predicted nucleic acid-binding protein